MCEVSEPRFFASCSLYVVQDIFNTFDMLHAMGAFDSAKNHKRQSRKRQSVTAKRGKSQTPKFVKVRSGLG